MEKFEIVFCSHPNDGTRMFIARALAEGENAYEAAPKAYEYLKGKYPDIKPGDWLGTRIYSSLDLTTPIEYAYPPEEKPIW